MEAGARDVALVVVGRDLGAALLERVAIAHGAVADADAAGRRARRSAGTTTTGSPSSLGEDLLPLRVDHRERAGRARGQRVERRDAGDRDAERERERPRGRERHADAR